ncbi:MAG: nucleotide sugar dehydrogenase [Bacteroidota bacterium]
MTVSIFGLGYVGVVSAVCFARDGINVIGVDINQDKIDKINKGIPPIVEKGLNELLKRGLNQSRITATSVIKKAIESSDVSVVSVGTPSREDGALDLHYVRRVCEDIAQVVYELEKDHTLIIRSTVFPGTTTEIEEHLRSKFVGIKLHMGFNPEFLREGTAIQDFDEAAYTIIGSEDIIAIDAVRRLYATVDAPIHEISPQEAELIKYAANFWHATKIAFANEIGRIANHLHVDGRTVMDILVSDEKLNISKAYMKPGFAYGGSCLPKDVRAIEYFSKVNGIRLPLVSSLAESNQAQIDLAMKMVMDVNAKKVGILGLAFKSGTDDLRESPSVTLAEKLLGKGVVLRILDSAVQKSKLIGTNLDYISSKIPHLSEMIVSSPWDLIDHSELIIVTHGAAEFRQIIEQVKGETWILDLTGIYREKVEYLKYRGIAW